LLCLSSCDYATTTITAPNFQTSDSSSADNKIETSDNILGNSSKRPVTSKIIHSGDTIELDFVEMSIEGISTAKAIYPDKYEKYISHYLEDIEGETYVCIYGNMKNISGETYEIIYNTYASILFDNQYNYEGAMIIDEGDSLSYFSVDFKPLQSAKYYIYASVPDEMLESYTTVNMTFGFKEGFEDTFFIEEDDCDYLFHLIVRRDKEQN